MKIPTQQMRVEEMLRRNGFMPLRQFSPAKADMIGTNELFEIWHNGPELVIVHFFGNDAGVDLYCRDSSVANTWDAMESKLAALNNRVMEIPQPAN